MSKLVKISFSKILPVLSCWRINNENVLEILLAKVVVEENPAPPQKVINKSNNEKLEPSNQTPEPNESSPKKRFESLQNTSCCNLFWVVLFNRFNWNRIGWIMIALYFLIFISLKFWVSFYILILLPIKNLWPSCQSL